MYSLAKVPAGRGQRFVSPTLSDLSLSCGMCVYVSVGVVVGKDRRVARLVVRVDSQRGRPVDV